MKQNLLKPTYLKQLCTEYGFSPSKKYGQNYLISDAPIKKMIASADIRSGDTVIEIGPGFGVLTFALADVGAQVVAFEIERKLQRYWDEHKTNNIKIIWGNALHELSIFTHRAFLFGNNYQFSKPFKVVANLPYQITSQVLRTLLELEHPPESITVMVQKEVAERICAKPARKASPRAKGNMSLLAVSVQYYGVPKMVAKVTKGNFWPEPKVDSAILEIRNLKSEIRDRVSDRFFDVVKAGFSNKRKQAWRNISVGLGIDGEVVKQVLDEVVGNEKVRAQELSVEEWVMVVEKLSTQQT